ncbi:MAG: Ig-like domain-containing protein [Sandaracinaceae bacterium]
MSAMEELCGGAAPLAALSVLLLGFGCGGQAAPPPDDGLPDGGSTIDSGPDAGVPSCPDDIPLFPCSDMGPLDGGFDGGTADAGPPPYVVSSTPTQGTDDFSVIGSLGAVFSEPMDAASVLDATRFYWGWERQTGTVSYDAGSRTVIFDPDVPLSQSDTCRLRIEGARTPDGRVMVPFEITFDARPDLLLRSVEFHPDGDVFRYERRTYQDRRLTRMVGYDGPGQDGVWFNDDDDLEYGRYREWTREDDGSTRFTRYDGPGDDDVWFTADDEVSYTAVYVEDSEGRSVTHVDYTEPGPDGVWATADDLVRIYTRYQHAPDVSLILNYDDPGPDGVWGTGDDVLVSYNRNTYDQFLEVSVANYRGPGRDGAWLTADDEAQWYLVNHFDAADRWTREVSYGGPGGDGLWGTCDDVPDWVELHSYDDDGRPVRHVRYSGPGNNCVWLDDDDEVQAGSFGRQAVFPTVYSWTGRTMTRSIDFADAGADGVWFTADDTVASYLDLTHNVNRQVTRELRHNDPGEDGLWFTDDDPGSGAWEGTYDADGAAIEGVELIDPGPDGEWFTGDDRVRQRDTYLP